MLMASVCTDANPTNREEKTQGGGGFTFLCETFFFLMLASNCYQGLYHYV